MQIAVITGATGFIGSCLVERLLRQGIRVYAVCRPNSKNAARLERLCCQGRLQIIELNMHKLSELPQNITEGCDVFYHLAWNCQDLGVMAQQESAAAALAALKAAKRIGCRRFIGSGSQAEYGVCREIITEETRTHPLTAYGAAKLSACHFSRVYAKELEIEWAWGRIFSVYGPGDRKQALLPYLIRSLKQKIAPQLTEGKQPWDYLYVTDAAEALYALGAAAGREGIYNIARGESKPLRWFIEKVSEVLHDPVPLRYGQQEGGMVSLRADIEKIRREIGWNPRVNFENGVKEMLMDMQIKCNKIPTGGGRHYLEIRKRYAQPSFLLREAA